MDFLKDSALLFYQWYLSQPLPIQIPMGILLLGVVAFFAIILVIIAVFFINLIRLFIHVVYTEAKNANIKKDS